MPQRSDGDACLTQLHAFARELEGRPPSEKRDAVLRELRARIVALETGSELTAEWSQQASAPSSRRGSAPRATSAAPRLAEVSPPLVLEP
jgi:hypothetical protein